MLKLSWPIVNTEHRCKSLYFSLDDRNKAMTVRRQITINRPQTMYAVTSYQNHLAKQKEIRTTRVSQ